MQSSKYLIKYIPLRIRTMSIATALTTVQANIKAAHQEYLQVFYFKEFFIIFSKHVCTVQPRCISLHTSDDNNNTIGEQTIFKS